MEGCVGVWVKPIKNQRRVPDFSCPVNPGQWDNKNLPKYFIMGQSKHFTFLTQLALGIVTETIPRQKQYPDQRGQLYGPRQLLLRLNCLQFLYA